MKVHNTAPKLVAAPTPTEFKITPKVAKTKMSAPTVKAPTVEKPVV